MISCERIGGRSARQRARCDAVALAIGFLNPWKNMVKHLPDGQKPTDDGNRSVPKPPRILPDVEICRAKDIGIEEFGLCLVLIPVECKYARCTTELSFCNHPQRQEIVARTEAKNGKIIN